MGLLIRFRTVKKFQPSSTQVHFPGHSFHFLIYWLLPFVWHYDDVIFRISMYAAFLLTLLIYAMISFCFLFFHFSIIFRYSLLTFFYLILYLILFFIQWDLALHFSICIVSLAPFSFSGNRLYAIFPISVWAFYNILVLIGTRCVDWYSHFHFICVFSVRLDVVDVLLSAIFL